MKKHKRTWFRMYRRQRVLLCLFVSPFLLFGFYSFNLCRQVFAGGITVADLEIRASFSGETLYVAFGSEELGGFRIGESHFLVIGPFDDDLLGVGIKLCELALEDLLCSLRWGAFFGRGAFVLCASQGRNHQQNRDANSRQCEYLLHYLPPRLSELNSTRTCQRTDWANRLRPAMTF